MAADDIFLVRVFFELPTSSGSYGLYYKETTEATGADLDTEILGDAFDDHMGAEILDLLSNDCRQPMITCEKLTGAVKAPRHDVQHSVDVGQFDGPSLPNNCALNCRLNQGTFSSRSDGLIKIPGIPEPGIDGVTMNAGYQTGVANAFVQKLALLVPELSAGPGRWALGVISAKVRDAALPAKDWDGAFAPVTSISLASIIGVQSNRSTRAEGVGGTTP